MFALLLPRIALADDKVLTTESFPAKDLDFFEKSIRPVLVKHCQECHGEKKQKAGLRLDSREALLTGGEQGAAIVPGKPEESLLIVAVRYRDENLQMPERLRP